MLNIVIFGAPGSGKGTYSARLVEAFELDHISTGDVLRNEIKNGTELGKIAQSYIDHGNLIPDELMIDILAHKYDSFKGSKGVIFDGFPRTIAQAEALKKMLEERGEKISAMINLEVRGRPTPRILAISFCFSSWKKYRMVTSRSSGGSCSNAR